MEISIRSNRIIKKRSFYNGSGLFDFYVSTINVRYAANDPSRVLSSFVFRLLKLNILKIIMQPTAL